MSKEQTAVGPNLFGPLLLVSTLGYGLLNLPDLGASLLGPSGYLAQLAALPIAVLGLGAIYLLGKRFPGKTLVEQAVIVLGKVLGRTAGLAYLVFALLMLTMFTRDILNLVGAFFLNRTPLGVLALTYLAVAAYLASKGLETIARLGTFLFIPALLVLLLLMLGGFQNFSVTRVLPVETNPLRLFRGGMSVLYIYYVLGASAIALPMFRPAKAVPRTLGWVLLGATAFYTIFAFGTIGVFGHDHLQRWGWPSMEFVHAMDYPYLLLEQAGMLMLIDWITIILAGTGLIYYVVALGTSQVFGVLDYKRWVGILLPVIFALILIPRNIVQTKWAFEFVARYGWLAFFAFPAVLLVVAVLLGRRGADTDGA